MTSRALPGAAVESPHTAETSSLPGVISPFRAASAYRRSNSVFESESALPSTTHRSVRGSSAMPGRSRRLRWADMSNAVPVRAASSAAARAAAAVWPTGRKVEGAISVSGVAIGSRTLRAGVTSVVHSGCFAGSLLAAAEGASEKSSCPATTGLGSHLDVETVAGVGSRDSDRGAAPGVAGAIG